MSRRTQCIALAAVVLFAAGTASAGDMSAATKAVWQRHVERAMASDLDAVMLDFGEQSVIITADRTLRGKDAIRKFFKDFLAALTPEAKKTLAVNSQTIHGEVLVSNFTIGSANRTFHDMAVIRDDRIQVLSTVDYPAN